MWMHHGGFEARPVLHRRRNILGELAPMHLAAGATRFENPVLGVLGDFVAQGRAVEHLAGLDHDRVDQWEMTGGTVARREVGPDVVRRSLPRCRTRCISPSTDRLAPS